MDSIQSRLGANRRQLWKVRQRQSNRCKSRSMVSPRPSQKQRPTRVEIGGNTGGHPNSKRRVVVSPHEYRQPSTDTTPTLRCRHEAEAGEARAHPRLQTRSPPGHRFGHSFARTECEQTSPNATKIAEFSRNVRRRTSFGTTPLPALAKLLEGRIANNITHSV